MLDDYASMPEEQATLFGAKRISELLQETPIAFFVLNQDGWQMTATPKMQSAMGTHLVEAPAKEVLHKLLANCKTDLGQWFETGNIQHRLSHRTEVSLGNHHPKWFEVWVGKGLAAVRDVDEYVRTSEQYSERHREADQDLRLLYKALNASSDGFAVWTRAASKLPVRDHTYLLKFINSVGAEPSGRHPAKLVGSEIHDVLGIAEADNLAKVFDRALAEQENQVEVVQIGGEYGWQGAFENKVIPLSKDTVVTSFRDVSEEMKEKVHLKYRVDHDALTGLASRSALEDRLFECLGEAQETGKHFAFIFLDLDHFKTVNDRYGHEVGDLVLKHFADVLMKATCDKCKVARISGDEFAIICSQLDSHENAEKFLEKLVESVREKFVINNHQLELTASAGLALVENPNCQPSEVFRTADRAMYAVKHRGRNGFEIVTL